MAVPHGRMRVLHGQRADAVRALDGRVRAGELVDRDVRVGHRRVRDLARAQGRDLGVGRVQQAEGPAGRLPDDHLTGVREAGLQAVAVGEHERRVGVRRVGEADDRAGAVAERDGPGEADGLEGGRRLGVRRVGRGRHVRGGGLGRGCRDGGCRARPGYHQGEQSGDERHSHVGVPSCDVGRPKVVRSPSADRRSSGHLLVMCILRGRERGTRSRFRPNGRPVRWPPRRSGRAARHSWRPAPRAPPPGPRGSAWCGW